MCGIAGLIETEGGQFASGAAARQLLSAMLRTLEHRGPDDWGMAFSGLAPQPCAGDGERVLWLAPEERTRLALGHRRLSILDLSPAGRQPMRSADGQLILVFNGEIYNYIELREELSRHATFRSGTDTEVLLEAYRQWGTAMLERLDGMFAFALWDARQRKLICARDPLGIKPFYFASEPGQPFVFASEPGAVLAGLETPGHLDAARNAEFLVLGLSDHDTGTSFREVRQLPGGHWMEVDGMGQPSPPQPFWNPGASNGVAEHEVALRVRAQIELAVRRQLRSDVPVGSCLSGGLDSGSVVASVGRTLGTQAAQFTTLTIVNRDFGGDEAPQARATAERAGVSWVPVEADLGHLADDLERMARLMGEPFLSLSMLAQYKVMQEARSRGLKVMLDGQGGDEVFLGYPRAAQLVMGEYLRRGRVGRALHEWRAFGRNASQSLLVSALGNVFFASPRLACWRNRRRLHGLVDPALLEQVRPETAASRFQRSSVAHFQSAELTRYVLPRLLRYEDRNSMAFSVEARVPLLAVGLVDEVLRLPLHWKVRDGWTKYALRQAMADRLAPEILWSCQKRGFEVPQRRWVEALRPHLHEWLRDLPADAPVQPAALLARVDAGQGGAPWLWRCLSLALWMRFSGVRL